MGNVCSSVPLLLLVVVIINVVRTFTIRNCNLIHEFHAMQLSMIVITFYLTHSYHWSKLYFDRIDYINGPIIFQIIKLSKPFFNIYFEKHYEKIDALICLMRWSCTSLSSLHGQEKVKSYNFDSKWNLHCCCFDPH